MRFARSFLVALLVAPALVVVGATQALACSCVPARPDKVAVKDANAVFSGTMVEADVAEPGFTPGVWTFAVDEVYKGEVERSQEVKSHTQSAACGLIFKEGKRYAVFAYDNKGSLETNSCMNTRPLDDGEELELEPVAAFEAPPPPEDGSDVTSTWDPIAIASFGLIALVALVTLGVFVAGKRGKSRNPGGPGTPEGPPS